MGDSFDGIFQAVRPVVGWIDAPGVARAVVCCAEDAVHNRVSQIEVGVRHIDFGAEGFGAVGEFAFSHALEEVDIFLDGAVAEWAVLSGLG